MNPDLGRFISVDPVLGNLASPQTINRYAYCVNNPLRFIDPTGMLLGGIGDWFEENWKTVVVVAVVAIAAIAITCTAGAATPLAAIALDLVVANLIVGTASGIAVNTLSYIGEQYAAGGSITAEGVLSSAASGAIGGFGVGAGMSLAMMGHPIAGLAVGAIGGESAYLSGGLIREVWPGGAQADVSVGGMFMSAFFGAAGVGFGNSLRVVGRWFGVSKPGITNPSFSGYESALRTYGGMAFFSTADSVWKAFSKFTQREAGGWLPIFSSALPRYSG
ncbi:MAG TPA: hypothetical protein HA364_05895 [Thermoplasmata archaeon]|nr:hypothetical protein [Thermoplasmata archaeon]